MGAAASIAAAAGSVAMIAYGCSSRQTRRWSKRREKPHAVFEPDYFRGIVFTQLDAVDPASAGHLNPVDVTVRVWRDRIDISRSKRDKRHVTVFKADPPVGLKSSKGAILQLLPTGLLWGRHGTKELVDRATMVLWHFEKATTIQKTLRRIFEAAESV
jgi:hypothetical protein